MKIGLVVERFDPLRGGLEQWTYCFAEKLVERGHEVHVVSREFSPRAAALPIIAHQVRHVHGPVAFAAAAEEKLASLPLDVIHDMGVGWYCDVFHPHGGSWASVTARKMLLAPRWLRPLKYLLHHVMPRYHVFRRLMARQYADHGQIMVALSRSVADDFARFHQVAPERIRIVYNGVDVERFSPARCAPHRQAMRRRLGIGPDTILLLMVATNLPLKGIATLLRTLARLRGRGLPVRLLVVGGKRPGPWRRMAARLGVAAAVQFHRAGGEHRSLLCRGRRLRPSHDLRHVQPGGAGGGGLRLAHRHHPLQRRRRTVPRRPRHRAGRRSGRRRGVRRRGARACWTRRRAALGEAARRTATTQTFDRNVDNIVALYEEVVAERARRAGRSPGLDRAGRARRTARRPPGRAAAIRQVRPGTGVSP